MSDEKKGGEGGGGGNLFVDAIFWLLLILVIYSFLKGVFATYNISFDFLPSVSNIFASIFNVFQVFSIFISLLFLIGIIYFNVKLGEILHGHGHGHGDHGHEGHDDHNEIHGHHNTHPHTADKRWLNIQTRLASPNEADWRLAIIEADIILDDMLTGIGYKGNAIGDKLKQANRADFRSLDRAWEAHKVRNRIAHDGASFHITHSEATRVLGLYKKVFDEFYYI